MRETKILSIADCTLKLNAGLTPVSICLLSFNAWPAAYYISPVGNDSANGATEINAWKTFSHAFSSMSGGDELLLLDGTYSNTAGTGYINYNDGANPQCGQPPSGTGIASITVVRAKNPGSVIIDGGSRTALFLGRSFRKDSHVIIQGIKFEGGGQLYNTSHITLKECSIHSESMSGGSIFGIGTNDHENGNSYNLIEDCWIWGKARIIAGNYRSDNNVWRRVVIRGDGCNSAACTGSGNPNVGFSVYDSKENSIQNMIVIDRILNGGSPYAGFATAQHTPGAHSLGPNEWLGCIVLNNEDLGIYFEADAANDSTHILRNIVAWHCNSDNVNIGGQSYNIVLENITAGITGAGMDNFRVAPEVSSGLVRNIIVYQQGQNGRFGVNSKVQPSDCDVYGSFSSVYNQTTCMVGCKTTNPLNDGAPASLKYLIRIENGSALKNTGAGGKDYGANIVYRYGIEGSRYGEPGYNTLTSNGLWPWPNEDRIKADMRSASTRGFCSDSMTITKYIWEYLGNPIPDSIYNPPSEIIKSDKTILLYNLRQNFPNPFNPVTNIQFSMCSKGSISLSIYDQKGKMIESLLSNKSYEPGVYTAIWDGTDHSGRNAPSGIYYYQISSGIAKYTKKMVVLR